MDAKDNEENGRKGFRSGQLFDRALLVSVLVLQIFLFFQYRGLERLQDGLTAVVPEKSMNAGEIGLKDSVTSGADRPERIRDAGDNLLKSMSDAMMNAHKNFESMESMMTLDAGWDELDIHPAMDIREGEKAFTVVVTVPDASGALDVDLDGRILSIVSSNNASGRMLRRFEQKILLPGPVEGAESLVTTVTNDTVRIVIPKSK